jgi:hypothetical protein
VNATAAPLDYARCLTRLAERRMSYRKVALALSAWSGRSELARRVYSLLQPMRTMSPLQARASIVLLSLGLAGGAVGMARVPAFVSFTDAIPPPLERVATSTANPTTVQTLPMAYRQTAQPHATLLKAVLTSSKTRRVAPKPVITQSLPTKLRNVSAAKLPQEPYMVLTTAEMQNRRSNRKALRQVYVVSTEFSYSYAAVPFADGWLIIQL